MCWPSEISTAADSRRLFATCEKAVALEEGDFGSSGMLITCYTALGNREAARRAAEITLARAEKVLARDS